MKKYSKIICTILTVCMMLCVMPFGAFAERISFNDISGNWAEQYILEMANKRAKDGSGYVIGGYADGSFRPNDNITRGAVAAILDRDHGYALTGATRDFTDVPRYNTFYKNIMACADNGVINGYADGSFKPTNSITRQAAIAMIARCSMTDADYTRYADKTACRLLLSAKFSDVSQISEQFYAEFCFLCTSGNLEGYPDGTVRPGQSITRAQFVKLLSTTTISHGDDPHPVVPSGSYFLTVSLESENKTIEAGMDNIQSDAAIIDTLMDIAIANEAEINTAFPSSSGTKSLSAFITIYEMCSEDGWNANTKENWRSCISAQGDNEIISACSDPESSTPISTLSLDKSYKVTITDAGRTYALTVTLTEN